MSLILPTGGPSWAYYADNFSLTADGTSQGTSFTASANHTKGSVATMITATACDVEHVRVGISGIGSTGVMSSALVDIMIDPAGGTDWSVLIPNLAAGYTSPVAYAGQTNPCCVPLWVEFPLWIPAGARLGVRGQTAHTSNLTGRAYIHLRGGNRNPGSWWCGQRVTAIGVDTATSCGVVVTPLQQPSFSDWVNIGDVLSTNVGAIQTLVHGESDVTMGNSTYYFQVGANGTVIGPTVLRMLSSEERGTAFPTGLVHTSIPAGTQLQVRGSMSNSFGQPVDVAVYCVS